MVSYIDITQIFLKEETTQLKVTLPEKLILLSSAYSGVFMIFHTLEVHVSFDSTVLLSLPQAG